MYRLTIETKQEKDPRSGAQPRKGRSFSAIKLAHITADGAWEGGKTDTDDIRPVWLMVAGKPTELRPFLMNLKSGRRAEQSILGGDRGYSRDKPTRYALLKSAGYTYSSQRLASGEEVVTIYLPELCNLDPGMIDPKVCRFLCLTPIWWANEQMELLRNDPALVATIVAHGRKIGVPVSWSDDEIIGHVPWAAHVTAYLEQRTRRPIPSEPAFALQLLLAGLKAGVFSLSQTKASESRHRYGGSRVDAGDTWVWARQSWATGFIETDTRRVGLLSGVLCEVKHEALDTFLAAQVKAYFEFE